MENNSPKLIYYIRSTQGPYILAYIPVQEKYEGRVEKGVEDMIAHVEIPEELNPIPFEVHEGQSERVQQNLLQLLSFVLVNSIVLLKYFEDFQEEG